MPATTNLLELIQQQVPRTLQATQESGAATEAAAAKSAGAAENTAAIARRNAEDVALITLTAQNAKLKAQQDARAAFDAAGGMEQQLRIISTMAAAQDELVPALEQRKRENMESAGFSPLAWIRQAFDVNGTYATIRSNVDTIQTLSETSRQIEQKVNATGQLAAATAQVMTEETIQASTRLAASEWQMRANQADMDGWKYNAQQVAAAKEASLQTLDILHSARGAERAEQQYKLAMAAEQRRSRMDAINERLLLAREAELKDEKALDDLSMHFINIGEVARGLNPSTGLQLKSQLQLLKRNDPTVAELYHKGRVSATMGISVIGFSPSDTAKVIAKNPQILDGVSTLRRKGLELITEAQAALGDLPETSPVRLDKTGAAAAQYIDTRVQTKVREHLSFIGNNPENPFYVGDVGELLRTEDPRLQAQFDSLPLIREVLKPLAVTGTSLADPIYVMKVTQEAVLKGTITSSQAADNISTLYRRANLLHRSAMDLEGLGINMPKEGAGYVVKVDGDLVDLTKSSDVSRVMNRGFVRRVYLKQKDIPTSFNPLDTAKTFGRLLEQGARKVEGAP